MPADFPFGFAAGGGEDRPDDLSAKMPLFAELEKLMNWRGGPVNWDLARQVAIKVASENDPTVSPADVSASAEALRLADLWLDDATTLPSGLGADGQAWSRVRFVEATLPVWQKLIDPVAAQVTAAMGGSLQSGLAGIAENGLPPELAGMLPAELAGGLPRDAAGFQALLGPMLGMLNQVGGLLFGSQVGQALGTLATGVLSPTEVGLPLAPAGVTALLPANLAAFGDGLEVDPQDLRLFLALREAAAARLFGHVPWLRAGLLGAVEEYARGITVDPETLQRSMGALQGLDPSDPETMARAMGEGLFDVPDSPEQQRTLARLETLLALVEGWVDSIAAAAAGDRLPQTSALREAVRRRRAAGGPAEATFSALVGLQLRPRRLREAAALWERLAHGRGIDGRDALWAHPDLLPHAEDLEDPAAFLGGEQDMVGDDPVGEIEALMAAQARPPAGGDGKAATEPRNPEQGGGPDDPEGPPPAAG
jgi:putative hydrolase